MTCNKLTTGVTEQDTWRTSLNRIQSSTGSSSDGNHFQMQSKNIVR